MRVPRGVAKSDEEKWTKDRALGDTAGGCVPGRQVSYTFDTEGTR